MYLPAVPHAETRIRRKLPRLSWKSLFMQLCQCTLIIDMLIKSRECNTMYDVRIERISMGTMAHLELLGYLVVAKFWGDHFFISSDFFNSLELVSYDMMNQNGFLFKTSTRRTPQFFGGFDFLFLIIQF
jgi:hypothetical protein